MNYFRGNDQSKWKTNVPSYNSVSLGEINKGVELTLKAYGKNVEKRFAVMPYTNPESIKITLQGAKDLKINDRGELEVLTDHGPITFTKPLAYQEIDGKRVEIDVSYQLISSQPATHSESSILHYISLSYNFMVGTYNSKYPLIIDPLLASTFIGGADYDARGTPESLMHIALDYTPLDKAK